MPHARICLTLTALAMLALAILAGCSDEEPIHPYSREQRIILQTRVRQTWAVAPAVNLSGENSVDAILQADAVYRQLQEVQGLTVIPVDRVVQVYAGLRIQQVESAAQAAKVCERLGVDALIVPTVMAYNPYNPPKMAASLSLFGRAGWRPISADTQSVDPAVLARAPAPNGEPGGPPVPPPMPPNGPWLTAVGMFDAANGTTRAELMDYAEGRYDPNGPYRAKEFLVNMDRFNGFVYRKLIENLMDQAFIRAMPVPPSTAPGALQPKAGGAVGR